MLRKKVLWQKEQEELDAEHRDSINELKKTREREEENYTYQRDLLRKKDQDQYETLKNSLDKELTDKRTALDNEFTERENKLLTQEKELTELKEQVASFPEILQNTITQTEQSITERLTFTHDYESKLIQKGIEGERTLYTQQVAALEAKVAQLELQAKQLIDKSNQASLQVQDIAVKAIEGASHQRYIASPSPVDKAAETPPKPA
jgi:hypothetical protein